MSLRQPWTEKVLSFFIHFRRMRSLLLLSTGMEPVTGFSSVKSSKRGPIPILGLANNADKGNYLLILRWHNNLDPSITKRPWSLAEEQLMF